MQCLFNSSNLIITSLTETVDGETKYVKGVGKSKREVACGK